MTFPNFRPSSRRLDPGNWPVKTFSAQDGAEVRFLYGNRRTKMKLDLSYQNIRDTEAEQFLQHFESLNGTFETFEFDSGSNVTAGWTGAPSVITAAGTGNRWRYDAAPSIESVRPGVSNVSVTLVGVF